MCTPISSPAIGDAPKTVNAPGLAHLAFAVDDVAAAVAAVLAAAGSMIGEIVDAEIEGVGRLRFCYAAAPEGDIIELQHWESGKA